MWFLVVLLKEKIVCQLNASHVLDSANSEEPKHQFGSWVLHDLESIARRCRRAKGWLDMERDKKLKNTWEQFS